MGEKVRCDYLSLSSPGVIVLMRYVSVTILLFFYEVKKDPTFWRTHVSVTNELYKCPCDQILKIDNVEVRTIRPRYDSLMRPLFV